MSVTYQENDIGESVPVETKRRVMADKQSVRQSEFYQAAIAGLGPEVMFVVRSWNTRAKRSWSTTASGTTSSARMTRTGSSRSWSARWP